MTTAIRSGGVLLACLFTLFSAAAQPTTAVRQRLLLDRGWLFHEGDVPFPKIIGHQPSYDNAKAGVSWGAANPNFDDAAWRPVDLPHDWAVEQPFNPAANLSQGYRDRGMGWYRKYFRLDPRDHGKYLELQFDGIATHATIWINGVLAERSWTGYKSTYIDITPFARFGSDLNVIAVQVDANAMEGWWYEGAGIYRHVWLLKGSPVHIETDGVSANPIRDSDGQWSIPVEVSLSSSDKDRADVEVKSILLDAANHIVGRGSAPAAVGPLSQVEARYTLHVSGPKLWSVDQPNLYSVRTEVRRNGVLIDELVTRCGFRTIHFDPDKGFFLNDRPLKLLGTANHQDHAGVGVAVPDSLWDFRIRRLKAMGSNFYRCAHNAPAAEFLDAADRLGMLVMDENRNFGSTPEHLKELDWMVRRDRNHPSVVLWSVFNEEPSQGTEMGYEMVRRMRAAVREIDTTRPVTAAQSNSVLNPVNASQAADVAGFNYVYRDFDQYHRLYPSKPIFSSEDTSTVMTRDEYETDRAKAVLDSYDDQVLPWGLSHRNAWKEVATRSYVAGTTVWTGFDYRGEPQPLPWPAAGSSFGSMDLCGFPKSAYYIHQAQWIRDRPILHLWPHWNWSGSEGKPIKVMVASNAEKVAIVLNGKEIEEKPVDLYQMATFDIPYAPGKLEAIASTGGREVARFAVETTSKPEKLSLVPDRTSLAGDGDDAQPITVAVLDAQGRVVPTADPEVTFSITGPGTILGLDNGDPNNHESEKGQQHKLFHGLAQVIIKSEVAGQGRLVLRATADGLSSAETMIDITAAARPAVDAIANPPLVVTDWKRAPFTEDRPDLQQVSEDAVAKWEIATPGSWLPPGHPGKFTIYQGRFISRPAVQRDGGRIVLRKVAGKAQVWIDGRVAGQKTSEESADLIVPCSSGTAQKTITVLIETSSSHVPAGIGGVVTVE